MLEKLEKHFKIYFAYSLKKYNTFGMDVKAKAFVSISTTKELQEILKLYSGPVFILGGGSNLLLTKDIDALVIHNQISEKTIIRKFKKSVYVKAGGGENWHQFVLWTIKKGLGGLENLSLIPGTIGAAPIQNIGAYGVEVKDVFRELKAVDLKTGALKTFKHKDCQFGYRNSIFKNKYKSRYCICEVTFKLSLFPKLNISYGAIRNTLNEMNVRKPNIATVSKAVIQIRSSKLPNPAQIGNSGSFFKNPEVSNYKFRQLQKANPNMPSYPLPNNKTKIPAGWLIEQCGWKGKRIGETGCHKDQALVLVNYGNAKGSDVWQLAQDVMASVKERFGIELTAEVNVL